MKKDLLKGLSEEQIAKVKDCKNHDDLLALAKQEGLELTSEQLEAVNGGACSNTDNCPPCPYCGSTNVKLRQSGKVLKKYKCNDCGKEFQTEYTSK
ncbi:MAG: Nif11 family protein [Bacilli bacterium]|nr:Nif11 family protein [Bacilli bacterium]